MGLILPPNGFAYCTTNISGTPSATPGTALTASASINTDGTSVAMITAITHDVHQLVIHFSSSFVGGVNSAQNTTMLVDILIDPAGGTSWATAPLINDLLAGFQGPAISAHSKAYAFPIYIKSGASIGARVRCVTASATVGVIIYAYGEPARPDEWWCGSSVQSIGITAATSQGQSHTPGNSGAFSTWTNLGSTLTDNTGALQYSIQGPLSTTLTAIANHWEFGAGSTRIGPTIWEFGATTEIIKHTVPTGLILCNLLAGTQLQVRATCSTTGVARDVAAYAVQ